MTFSMVSGRAQISLLCTWIDSCEVQHFNYKTVYYLTPDCISSRTLLGTLSSSQTKQLPSPSAIYTFTLWHLLLRQTLSLNSLPWPNS